MKRRGLVFSWMPVIAWMILIFVGSSDTLSAEHTSRFIVPFLHWLDPAMSAATVATVHMTIRKLGHFTEYAILAALIWRGFRGTLSVSNVFLALCAFFAAAVFAASDEFHQSFRPLAHGFSARRHDRLHGRTLRSDCLRVARMAEKGDWRSCPVIFLGSALVSSAGCCVSPQRTFEFSFCTNERWILGSAGCQPAVVGSLPTTSLRPQS